MTFGIKKKQRSQIIGVKRGIHRASKIGTKALGVGELLFPEYIPEIELGKEVLKTVTSLTKERKPRSSKALKNTSESVFAEKSDKVAGF